VQGLVKTVGFLGNELRDRGERVWLFAPTRASLDNPAVGTYLAKGENGLCRKSYKISIREKWYAVPLPGVPHAFVSGMSNRGPYLVMNECTGLQLTNTLLGIWFNDNLVQAERYSIAISLLGSRARKQKAAVCRHYADGLMKFEPGDLARLPVRLDGPVRGGKAHYRKCIKTLLTDGPAAAARLADAWFGRADQSVGPQTPPRA